MALNMRPSGLILEKKQILAWYDTTTVYICLALFSLGTAVFSLVGIQVTKDVPKFSGYAWIPRSLLIMSAVLITFCCARLLKRGVDKYRSF